jgi:hypothetical protein
MALRGVKGGAFHGHRFGIFWRVCGLMVGRFLLQGPLCSAATAMGSAKATVVVAAVLFGLHNSQGMPIYR